MLLQFETLDGSIWAVDTQYLHWGRVEKPLDPNKMDDARVFERGRLLPQGFGVYALEGAPKNGPGNSLASFGTYVVGIGTTVKIFLRANVEVKHFTMPVPINQVLYEILPADEGQIKQSIQEMSSDRNIDFNSNPGGDSPVDSGSKSPEEAGPEPGTAG